MLMDDLTDRELDSLRRLAVATEGQPVIPPVHMERLFDLGFLEVISGHLRLTEAVRDRLSRLQL